MKKKRNLKPMIIVGGLVLIIALLKSIVGLVKTADRVKLAEEEIVQLRKEAENLGEQRDYYRSDEFVEKEARNKLNLARPGETVVILPENMGELLNQPGTRVSLEKPVWQEWREVFF